MGLGVALQARGSYGGGDGGLGTAWANDAEGSVAILMTQRSEYPARSSVHRDFWGAVYGDRSV